MPAAVVYVTVPSVQVAEKMAQDVVEARLAACANIIPQVQSVYRWEGKISHDQEAVLIFKTDQDRVTELISKVRELHEYEVPCITSWPITDILPEYLEWIVNSTRPE
ncbi:MAG: divalent-cation tolerance protein CutA [Planctomycetaceae bacterium]